MKDKVNTGKVNSESKFGWSYLAELKSIGITQVTVMAVIRI
jgi:hypothetical protein